MTKLLVVATGNPGKLKEMQAYLANLNWELTLKPQELEVDETGDTFAENACLKASQVALKTGHWAIADDSGLQVDALNGVPGVYSARYGNTDAERINRLLTELGDQSNRQAQFMCVVAIARPDGAIVLQSEGICRGEILHAPRGNGGLTFAEMTPEIKRSISHRGQAFAALIPQLEGVG
jgi:XTP/dITP diphosphohydrolase